MCACITHTHCKQYKFNCQLPLTQLKTHTKSLSQSQSKTCVACLLPLPPLFPPCPSSFCPFSLLQLFMLLADAFPFVVVVAAADPVWLLRCGSLSRLKVQLRFVATGCVCFVVYSSDYCANRRQFEINNSCCTFPFSLPNSLPTYKYITLSKSATSLA